MQLAGGKPPEMWQEIRVPTKPGISLTPLFAKDAGVSGRECLWWRHEGNRAIRVGDWKLVAAGKDARWELYDLAGDRGEQRNRAAKTPDKVEEMAALWEKKDAENRAYCTRQAVRPELTLCLPSAVICLSPAAITKPSRRPSALTVRSSNSLRRTTASGGPSRSAKKTPHCFPQRIKEQKIAQPLSHASYLINLASNNPACGKGRSMAWWSSCNGPASSASPMSLFIPARHPRANGAGWYG